MQYVKRDTATRAQHDPNSLATGKIKLDEQTKEGDQKPMEFAPWPYFGQEEINAAETVLRSGKVNYWTGQEGKFFEREFASYVGTKYAVALANGTVAIELALTALDVGSGDEVIVPSRTFIATGSAVVKCGATPVFADVDRDSQNITAETIEKVITARTKAVIVVHLNGWPCDMDPILTLADNHGLKVIEDCAQAIGATYKGKQVGSMGHAGAFSFCQDKIMTTGGEGGMLTISDERLWQMAWSYKDHGKDYQATHKKHTGAEFRWLHESFGTNWRMTEMQAAIGRVVLRKLPSWIEARRHNANVIGNCFSALRGLRVTKPSNPFAHSYYKYYVFVRPEQLNQEFDRDKILAKINTSGVPCYSGSCSEIYLEKAFVKAGLCPDSRRPIARELGETSLMFLVHPTLTMEHLEITCDVVTKTLRGAT